MKKTILVLSLLWIGLPLSAVEYHVSPTGSNDHSGTADKPLQSISAAADRAQPGDVVTVHAGIYREQVVPPRGGNSDTQRIVYQAAPGESVVITGSEIVKNWKRIDGDTWKTVVPNSLFGDYNPFAELIHGDWFSPNNRLHHTGSVYLNGEWLIEAAKLDEVMKPVKNRPLWYASVDTEPSPEFLYNLETLRLGSQSAIRADSFSSNRGTKLAPCSEGGQCVGFIRKNDWLGYRDVDFGKESDRMTIRAASASEGGCVEIRLDAQDGELLGTCTIPSTGDWQKWSDVTATIKPTQGKHSLYLVFKPLKKESATTTIWAQFPGVDPNEATVEINVRPTVFSPEKPGIDFLTLRGFKLRHAATNWAPPTAGQFGLVSAYWCKGWIIENNEVSYSKCSGIVLGKHGDRFDNTSADTAEGYVETIKRAYQNGWTPDKIGHHIVRHNSVHHCEQAGIVGSMGCAFSEIYGNEIYDIHVLGLFGGAEQAGIKFHAAVDTWIHDNHIFRTTRGIWLDWMAQGSKVTGNLLHENATEDLFLEVDHGPALVADNILLSRRSVLTCSNGSAFVHNLTTGAIAIWSEYTRKTPYLEPHGVQMKNLVVSEIGDDRWFNNLIVGGSLSAYDQAKLPVKLEGNLFLKNATPSKHESNPQRYADVDPQVKFQREPNGDCYLEIAVDPSWRSEKARKVITSALLGNALLPNQPFVQTDGSPWTFNTDYFGKRRNVENPFPGPFERSEEGVWKFKVWPIEK